MGWAKTYLKKAGLVAYPARGKVQITDRGKADLSAGAGKIDCEYLKKYPEFVEFVRPDRSSDRDVERKLPPDKTPDEAMEEAHQEIRDALADEILEQVAECTPAFFERLVLDVLLAMGYGGSRADAGRHLGKTGDGGIDGIIDEDTLGLDVICIQAKRWTTPVGRPEVQGFAGSMEAHRAKKGVLITTSTFSPQARDYVRMIERKIVLIDGKHLAQLMIDYNVGVSVARTYEVKRIDGDYFGEAD